jgi:AmiR/NasT family two-component response regulator
MEHRTAVDLACGMIMTESDCTQDEAFALLVKASQNRNQKVHDVTVLASDSSWRAV